MAYLLLLPAGAHASHDSATQRKAAQVEELLQQWQVEPAEQLLKQLVSVAPDAPATLVAQGHVFFFRGAYDQADASLQRALARSAHPDARVRALAALVRSTAKTVAGFKEHVSQAGHVIVRTRPGKDELLVPFIHETLEAMRVRLAHDLGYPAPERILVEVYASPEQLARVSPLTTTDIRRSGTIALCKYNRIMIVSPSALLRGYSWRDTLAHEYTHLVISRGTLDHAPIWFHEGLAKFFETRWRKDDASPPPLAPFQEHLLARALSRKRLLTWQQMHPSMAKLPSQRATALAFAEVQTAVSYLVHRGGLAGLRAILSELRHGLGVWDAIAKVMPGLKRPRFDATWRSYLRKLRLRKLAGLELPRLSFGQPPSKEQQIASIKQEQGRRHIWLAEMLRERGLVAAAVEEYQRAQSVVGERAPLVANALARAYLQLDEPAQAIGALRPVVEYYPDLASTQVTLALAYQQHGDRDRSIAHFEAALGINPFAPEIHCGLAQILDDGAQRELHQRICRQFSL